MQPVNDPALQQEAVELAQAWLNRSDELLTTEEKDYQRQIKHLLTHPQDKVVLTRLIDQSFRSENCSRVADQVNDLLGRYGIPGFFSLQDKFLMHLFRAAGRHLPSLSVPRMIEQMRQDSERVIISGEPDALLAHLRKRKEQGVRMNINHLGEAVLGEAEAFSRLNDYLADLQNPEVEYISVKISTIYSQIHSLAFEHSVNVLVERLTRLYRTAGTHYFEPRDGTPVPKFVNLDMEEYRDLEITTAAFMRALDQEAFHNHRAGIVLQAYLPDSLAIQEKLTTWARDRIARGGAPIKIRIVKGADLEMEQVESAIYNWPLAPYDNKRDVDANFKRMVHFGMQPERIEAVNLGIASHNLFDLAYAYCLAKRNGVTEYFIFEMLEGMADHVRRAIAEMSGTVLLYAPVAQRKEFINAIAYLVRRLDENTGAENFLRHAPGLISDSAQWKFLTEQFAAACAHMQQAPLGPNRTQDRTSERFPDAMGTYHDGEFNNEPDTDWSLADNRRWAEAIRAQWMKTAGDEAIDFAEYYPFSAGSFAGIETVRSTGKGVGVVVSPWNFPIAIPCGGIIAALAAGNTVIFKPSSDAVLVAWVLVECIWRAGISKKVLQFVPCPGGSAGAHLVSHADVDFVILTGGTQTGLQMLREKPAMLLCAETGGKNATIVTAMSDRDQAIRNVIYSAFGNSGQKCSATSLLILEKEVYASEAFKRQLVDAAASLRVGSSWDFSNRMGALIRPPSGDLKKALTTLEPGESWALEPQRIQDNPHMWTPGIKYGVQAGSYTHMTEFFGPQLGVMCADDLDHAIELVNQTGYGLTSGIESLDIREQEKWKDGVLAGNLYVNRGTTGAITLRQPFGGMRKSALGPAIKAGGPNYVSQFMAFEETALPRGGPLRKEHALLRMVLEWRRKLLWGKLAGHADDLAKVIRAVKSYLYHWEREFGVETDYFHLRGQDNIHRYRSPGSVIVRLHADDTLFETLARIAAARIAGNKILLSIPVLLNNGVSAFLDTVEGRQLLADTPVRRQPEEVVIAAMETAGRIRYAAPERVPDAVLAAAAESGIYIPRAPVLMEGRIELLHYLQNQSVCDTYHRYGNLGDRTIL